MFVWDSVLSYRYISQIFYFDAVISCLSCWFKYEGFLNGGYCFPRRILIVCTFSLCSLIDMMYCTKKYPLCTSGLIKTIVSHGNQLQN